MNGVWLPSHLIIIKSSVIIIKRGVSMNGVWLPSHLLIIKSSVIIIKRGVSMNGVWLPSHVHGRASRAAGSQEVKPKLTASAQLTPILYLPAKSARRRTSASPRHEVNLAEALGARP